jgi:hypothetical protein
MITFNLLIMRFAKQKKFDYRNNCINFVDNYDFFYIESNKNEWCLA